MANYCGTCRQLSEPSMNQQLEKKRGNWREKSIILEIISVMTAFNQFQGSEDCLLMPLFLIPWAMANTESESMVKNPSLDIVQVLLHLDMDCFII
ncbi:hypothetical protein scyTo_0000018 [Scyliorhinus torazame]|uniref:Uncharacterized protein n=1 Tax=Scyliorhinus torazame TaxID=75743 RepID=A0A401NN31_SCYTO|nr:hypothetical protein [Scyliorhinus torazame]